MSNLKVLSINLSNDLFDTALNQWPQSILNLFVYENLSLILIQEVDQVLIDSMKDFLSQSDFKEKYYLAIGSNSMILSLYPFIQSEVFQSSKKSKANVLVGKIKLPNHFETLVACISIDFSFFNLDYEYQLLKQVILKIDPDKDLPLILSGNFFDWNQSAFSRYEDLLNLKDVFKNFSGEYARNFPASVPLFCLDRIYIRHYTTTFCDLYYNNPIVTNHLPLLAEIKPKTLNASVSPHVATIWT